MEIPSFVVTSTGYEEIRDHLVSALPGARVEIVDPVTLNARGSQADVLIPTISRIDRETMRRVQGLRLIQQWGSGLERVDVAAATERGIAVANVPTEGTGNAESVAEWCVMAALVLGRRLPELDRTIRAGVTWGGPMGRALWGRTAGIVGMGGIGKALAVRLKPFGMRMLAVKRRPDPALAKRLGLAWLGGQEDLSLLLHQSDYLFLCLPLNDQTRAMIDEEALDQLPEGACIINAGRGGLLSEHALLRALAGGKLMGAALDVYEQEPLDPASPLLARPEVFATPHIAGVTDVSWRGIARRVADNACRLMAGRRLENCVNWDALAH